MHLIIQIEVSGENEQDFRAGKKAFIVPLSENETLSLGTDIILVHEGIGVLADSLDAFVEGRELYGQPDPELKAALGDIAHQLRGLATRQERTREVVGRAVLVANILKARKERMQ
jgi:hypothetical protein